MVINEIFSSSDRPYIIRVSLYFCSRRRVEAMPPLVWGLGATTNFKRTQSIRFLIPKLPKRRGVRGKLHSLRLIHALSTELQLKQVGYFRA